MTDSLLRLRDWLWRRRLLTVASLIVIIAAITRLWQLGLADPLTDEPSYLFRSLGYLDFLASPYQTTPLEWSERKSWWMWLSFHDHPPLYFFLQFIIFQLVGATLIAGRLLPAVAGIATTIILFDLVRRQTNIRTATAAGLLLASSAPMIWISRIGLQESFVIFLMALALWLTERLHARPRAYLWIGIIIGLALMTKLTAIIIWPVTMLYWFIIHRQTWRWSKALMVTLVSCIFFLPQAVYNLMMYRQFQHFDFQFSYYFGQASPWQSRPGREEFAGFRAIRHILPNIRSVISPVLALLSIAALARVLWLSLKRGIRALSPFLKFNLLALALIFLWLLCIGPSWRFIAMLIPWLLLLSAWCLDYSLRSRARFVLVISLLCLWELFFSWNTLFSLEWNGVRQWTYSAAKAHQYPYGYNQLDQALENFYQGKRPAVTLPLAKPVINTFLIRQAQSQSGEPVARLLIYDPTLYGEPLMWSLTRRLIYQGWPMISLDVYQEVQRSRGQNFFTTLGLSEYYYLRKLPTIPAGTMTDNVASATLALEQRLEQADTPYQSVYNLRGEEIFRLYTIDPTVITP